jgi:hypothetical protein
MPKAEPATHPRQSPGILGRMRDWRVEDEWVPPLVPAVNRVLCLMNPEMPEPRDIVPAARAQIDYLKGIKSDRAYVR